MHFLGFTSPCADSEFFCNNTHKCVSKKYRCDGEDDCGDHEDEQNCRKYQQIRKIF